MQIKAWQKQNWMLLFTFVVASLLLFVDTLDTPFFSDDFSIVRRLSGGDFDAGIFLRPLGDLSLYIDWILFGNNPLWFHFHNVVLHGITSFIVVCTAHEILKYCCFESGSSYAIALLTGFLFLLYPFHAETIIWVVGRGIVLSTLWFCLSIFLFCRYANTIPGYVATLFCFVIALTGYETALLLPLVIAMLVYVRYKKLRKVFLMALGHLVIGISFVFGRSQILGGSITGDEYFRLGPDLSRYLYNFGALAARSVAPPFNDSRIFVMVAGGLFLLLLLVMYKIKKKQSDIFLKVIYLSILFLVSLFPLVTVGIDTHDYEGGRFLYQSSIFFCLFISFIGIHAVQKKESRSILIGAVSIGYIYFLQRIKEDWKDAGKIITEILKQEIKLSNENYFFQVPDNKNGAYIFRKGLADAFALNHLMPDSAFVQILSFDDGRKRVSADTMFFEENKIKVAPNWQLDISNKILKHGQTQRINLNKPSASVFIFKGNGFARLYPLTPEL